MGRPAEVTTEEVRAAGELLIAEGKPVNAWSLRKAIGKGSPKRLLQLWTEMEEAPTLAALAAAAADTLPPLPSPLTDAREALRQQLGAALDGMTLTAWSEAMKLAETRTREEMAEARARAAQHEGELADAADALEQVEARETEIRAALEQAEAQLAALRAEAAEERGRLRALVEAAQAEAERERAARAAAEERERATLDRAARAEALQGLAGLGADVAPGLTEGGQQ